MTARRLRLGVVRDYVIAGIAVGATTVVAFALQPLVALGNLSLVYLTGVLLVAVRTAPIPACATALASALAYNFFFTQPQYTLYIHNTDELVTVVLFLAVGLIAGEVAGRLRQQMQALTESHQQAETLAELNRELAAAADPTAIAEQTASLLARRLEQPVVVLYLSEHRLELIAGSEPDPTLDAAAWRAAYRTLQTGRPMIDRELERGWRFTPMTADDVTLGVLGIHVDLEPLHEEPLPIMDLMGSNVALAIARARLAVDLRRAELAEQTEQLRSALLASVSHDLRTPLASMLGSATTLRDLGDNLSAEDRRELADAIATEGNRLNRYIRNLLDMTRLGQGDLRIERDWIGLDDILNSALRRLTEVLDGIRVVRAVPRDMPLLYVHPALIEQAIVNVLENAARFSPDHGTIHIEAQAREDELEVRISDEGPGIPPGERDRVFDRFFKGEQGNGDANATGLGLTICAGMVAAHMGRVEALPGPNDTGTTIVIRLPLIPPPEDTELDEQ